MAWLDLLPEGIPEAMRNEPRWVIWKDDKVPHQGHDHTRQASSTKPITWCTFDIARQVYEAGVCDGIGFVLGDGWAGVDLDKCLDGDDLHAEAASILQDLSTYAEVSPSGTGVKAFIRYQGGQTKGVQSNAVGFERIELYTTGRYFAITGHRLDDYGDEVQERTSQYGALMRRYGSTSSNTTATNAEHAETNGKIARNDTLCRMAGAARANGADIETIRQMMLAANEAIPQTQGGPLEVSELESTVFKSAAKWPQGDGAIEAKGFTPPEPMDADLDLHNIPPVDWLFNNMFVKGTVTGLDAAGGSGKTFALITLAASLALGRPLWPSVQPPRAGSTLLFLAEEDADIYRRRLKAIAYLHELTPEEVKVIGKKVCVYPQAAMQLVRSDNQGAVTPTSAYHWLSELAAEKKPDWIVLDPRSKFAGFVENSNEECNSYFELIAKVARQSGACITLAHHTSKAAELNTGSSAGRGASAARDAVRAQLNMGPFTERDAEGWAGRLGIVNFSEFIKLRLSKNNHGPSMSNSESIVLHRVHEGAMLEYDSKAAAADVEKSLLAGLSRTIATAVKDSPPTSKHEILREWKDERDAWREMYRCKNADIRRAIEHAIETGLMREELEQSASAGKPRLVLEITENCSDDD